MLRVDRVQARRRHCMPEPMARALPLLAVAFRANFGRPLRLEYGEEITISGRRTW
jgi:hypothetical protein